MSSAQQMATLGPVSYGPVPHSPVSHGPRSTRPRITRPPFHTAPFHTAPFHTAPSRPGRLCFPRSHFCFPQLDGAVLASGNDKARIRRPGGAEHGADVRAKRAYKPEEHDARRRRSAFHVVFTKPPPLTPLPRRNGALAMDVLSRPAIPELGRFVQRAADNKPAVRAVVDVEDTLLVARHAQHGFFGRCRVPQVQGVVLSACCSSARNFERGVKDSEKEQRKSQGRNAVAQLGPRSQRRDAPGRRRRLRSASWPPPRLRRQTLCDGRRARRHEI